jgi:beta-glucosidase
MGDDAAAYRDAQVPIDRRVEDLLARMTLEDKLAQLGGVWSTALLEHGVFSETRAAPLLGRGTGHVTRIAGATVLTPPEVARAANAIQRFLVERTRLGIPAIIHDESCAGFTARQATCFPQAIGLAATWAPALIEAMTRVIRTQMRAVGTHQSLAPVLDVARDPRWGRCEETFGEDPHLIAQMGLAYVRGLQGDDLTTGIAATAKHFLGYGASEGGMNWAPAHLSPRELLDVYAAPFEAVIRGACIASIMNAYHEIDGVPLGASPELLRDLLRHRLGFDGVVSSDYFTVAMLEQYHHFARDEAEAARLALAAGLDVELPALQCYGEPLRRGVEAGEVDPALVDASVRRVLRLKFALGLFECPYVEPERAVAVFDTAEQRALARRLAQQSIVLLKNDGDLLPLPKSLGTIAVIGPNADSIRNLQGDYHYPAHLEIMFGPVRDGDASPRPADASVHLGDYFAPMVTALSGIRAAVSPATRIRTARGCDVLGTDTAGFVKAVEAARQSDVAIVVVGDRCGLVEGCTSGESVDRSDLGLPGVQQALVEAVVATGTPTVVVLINGRPLALPWIAAHVPAIIEAWVPGEEGGAAVADVLFGDVNPAGRLPVSLPRSVGQVPVYYAHKPSGGRTHWKGDYADGSTSPLFPFGHGLSYTRFAYDGLDITPRQGRADGVVRIGVQVTNTGERAGEEVLQLYVRDVHASVTRPVKELKGFHRLALAPGERRTVTFVLPVELLALHALDGRRVVEPGRIDVFVGASSEDIRLRGAFEVVGATIPVTYPRVFSTAVEVDGRAVEPPQQAG